MASDEPLGSLEEALRARGVPLENWSVVRKAVDTIGIESYRWSGNDIRADRRDGGPHLIISFGWTNGFASRDEASEATGGRSPIYESKSRRGAGRWGIEHPTNQIREGGEARARRADVRDFGTCPRCHIAYSAAGTCDCD